MNKNQYEGVKEFKNDIIKEIENLYPNSEKNYKINKENFKITVDYYIPNNNFLIDIKYFNKKPDSFIIYRLIALRLITKKWGFDYLIICNDIELIPTIFKSFLDSKNIIIISKENIKNLNKMNLDFELKEKEATIKFNEFDFNLLPALVSFLELPDMYRNFILFNKLPEKLNNKSIKIIEKSGFFVFFNKSKSWAKTTQQKKLTEFLNFQNRENFIKELSQKYEENKLNSKFKTNFDYIKFSNLFLKSFFNSFYLKLKSDEPIRSNTINFIKYKNKKASYKLVRNYKSPSFQRILTIIGQSYYFKEKYSKNIQFIGIFDGLLNNKMKYYNLLKQASYFDIIVPLIKIIEFLREEFGTE